MRSRPTARERDGPARALAVDPVRRRAPATSTTRQASLWVGPPTYTAMCTISPSATGTLSNTATATVWGGMADPNPANNTATDTDTLTPQPIFLLAVGTEGTGSGAVTSSPLGIECGSDCSETYEDGLVVTLSATPAVGSAFTGWSGACSGTVATCAAPLRLGPRGATRERSSGGPTRSGGLPPGRGRRRGGPARHQSRGPRLSRRGARPPRPRAEFRQGASAPEGVSIRLRPPPRPRR